jgi:hypothetical protein
MFLVEKLTVAVEKTDVVVGSGVAVRLPPTPPVYWKIGDSAAPDWPCVTSMTNVLSGAAES